MDKAKYSVIKGREIEVIKNWINDLTNNNEHNQELLRSYNGDELEKMTLKELSMLTTYIKAAYNMGYKKGTGLREYHKKLRSNV